ncbi:MULTISPECIES: Spy/CpxP family protein refolding chaperone [Ramlibacter]|uniref:LTXXQ motif family protein n=1 Tax=Ramlibacter pinisoli TaxID=2682844 RepID=A0A6N8IM79_9BURK|nr:MULTISPECIES: Spy/CpxP family protein refolding chaperone [Ramlibacter]MBA2960580.1 Spy/CpxP family protein refolding chaperone [Ramlibacter sp. CGMCC 1.13660]MVQ27911.1 hypothetical protein [Ramlibacter pinisoli]
MQPSRRKHLFTGALLAAMAVAAQAQPAPGAAPAPNGRHDPARMAERVNKHLADLKQKLQLTPTQEPAWTSFSNAMQPAAGAPRPDRQALANLSTPDRLDQMRALRNQRNAEMDRRADATKAFYAQLSAEQKKTFDAETARLFQGRGGHGGRHHG